MERKKLWGFHPPSSCLPPSFLAFFSFSLSPRLLKLHRCLNLFCSRMWKFLLWIVWGFSLFYFFRWEIPVKLLKEEWTCFGKRYSPKYPVTERYTKGIFLPIFIEEMVWICSDFDLYSPAALPPHTHHTAFTFAVRGNEKKIIASILFTWSKTPQWHLGAQNFPDSRGIWCNESSIVINHHQHRHPTYLVNPWRCISCKYFSVTCIIHYIRHLPVWNKF